MPSDHRIAYALKHSPFLGALEVILLTSPLTQEQKLAALAAYEHLNRLALQGTPRNLYWLVLILEARGLHDIHCEDVSTVAGTLPNGRTVRLSLAHELFRQAAE
jgi:hypothetical protein